MADLKRQYLTNEKVYCWVTCEVDPTDTAPRWGFVAAGSTMTNTTSMEAGEWDADGWSTASCKVKAWSPLLTTGASLTTTGTYQPYVLITYGEEEALVKTPNQLVLVT